MLDTHCHLAHLPPETCNAFIAAAGRAGVHGFIAAAARPADWPALAQLAQAHPNVHVAIGIHPWFHGEDEDDARAAMPSRLGAAIAIGECGLDGRPEHGPLERQQATLAWQLDLAALRGLPVILHGVRATEPLLAMLADHPGLAGVIHGFSGSVETASRFLRLGFRIGLGPLLLNPRARRIRECAARLPEDAWLLETDAPAPGERDADPGLLARVARAVAALRGTTVERVAAASDANAMQLFHLEDTR